MSSKHLKSAGSYQLSLYPGTTCDVPAGPANLFTLVKRSRKNLLWAVSDFSHLSAFNHEDCVLDDDHIFLSQNEMMKKEEAAFSDQHVHAYCTSHIKAQLRLLL